MLHNYLVIEGNIGAGKTTLCQLLAADTKARLVLEQFADNPFLAGFYENPDRHAFTVELFFMAERYKQLQNMPVEQELFQQQTIADYFFIKTLLFAQKNLQGEEFRLFQRFFKILNQSFPRPDLMVYLHRPVPQLLAQIRSRGREYEQSLPAAYLEIIQTAYLDYFKNETAFPILVIDVGDADFVNEPLIYDRIVELINQPHKKGVSFVNI